MFQKIRKNKFFRKALVFASVFLILATTLVFPVLAQAPSISDIDASSFGSTEFYFSSPPESGSSNTVLLGFVYGGSSYYPLIFEGFFSVYGFSISDSPSTIYNALYDDYVNNSGNYTYRIYSYYDDEYSSRCCYEVFQNFNYGAESDFISMWNDYFFWEISKNQQVNYLNNQVNSLNNQLAAKDEQIVFQQNQIESANRQYQILSGQYDDLVNSYNTLQGENNTLQTNYNTLQSNYNTLQGENDTLNQNYNDLQADYVALESEWAELYEKYLNAQQEGYTNALNDYKAFEKGLFAIFNAPFTFVSNITGFEIFGISLVEVVVFILIICLAFVLLKFIGGSIL